MANEQGLFVRITADNTQLISSLRDSSTQLRRFGNALTVGIKTVARWGAAVIAAATAATAAFAGFASQITALDDFAQKIGESTVKLSAFLHVVEQSNVAQGDFLTAIQRQTRRLSEFATTGAGAAANAIQELNLDVNELMQQSPTAAFESIAKELSQVENGADKVRLAFGLWDSGGVDLLRIVDQGTDGIAALNEEGKKMATTAADVKTFQIAMGAAAKNSRNLASGWTSFMAAIERNIPVMSTASGLIDSYVDGLRKMADAMNLARMETLAEDMAAVSAEAEIANNKLLEIAYFLNQPIDSPMLEFNKVFSDQKKIVDELQESHRALSDELSELNAPADDDRGTGGGVGPSGFLDEIAEIAAKQKALKLELAAAEAAEEKALRDAAMQEQTEAIRNQFRTEEELTNEHYKILQEQLTAWRDAKLDVDGEYNELEAQLTAAQNEEIKRITDEAAASELAIEREKFDAKMNMASQALGNVAQLMNTESRKMFEVGKIAAISQAIIDGISAAISSYRVGSDIGGPIVGGAFAATSIIATGAQIQKLASTQYGSKSRGGGGMAGSKPSTDGGTQPPNQAAIIQLVGSEQSVFSRDQVTGLIGQINEAVGDGAQLAMG